ncbi:hypothetical protein PENTCL1PPCAC_24074, partial [Pristionchus entomophagus]
SLCLIFTCQSLAGIIEMQIPVNDAFICVSFYFRLKVIRGHPPSVKRTLFTLCAVLLLHTPLLFGYIEMHRKSYNIGSYSQEIELVQELRNLTYFGAHLLEIQKKLNVQLLILICFVIGCVLYTSMVLGLTRSAIVQFAIFPVSGLQLTLSPIANIIFIKPYR